MSRKTGFTMTEILTTIVILAVLAGIAIPGFSKSKDKATAAQAIAYLRTVRLGEKMYKAKNNSYWPNLTDTCVTSPCIATEIATMLGVELSGTSYTFTLTGSAATFTASAAKVGGTAADTITLDDAGVFRKNNVVITPN